MAEKTYKIQCGDNDVDLQTAALRACHGVNNNSAPTHIIGEILPKVPNVHCRE